MVNENSSKSTEKDSSNSDDSKKDADKNKAEAAALGVEEQLTPKQQAFKNLRDHIALIEKSVETRENRLILRVLRSDNKVRKQLSKTILATLLEEYCPSLSTYLDDLTEEEDEKANNAELVLQLKRLLSPPPMQAQVQTAAIAAPAPAAAGALSAKDEKKDDAMDIEKKGDPTPVPIPSALGGEVIPEVKAYLHHLLVLHFIDKKLFDEAATCSEALVNFLAAYNRRTLDWLSSKIYFYYDYAHSLINSLDRIRNSLLAAYRTACLQHNEPGQASLTVSILRNYVHYNLYASADAFRSKASFPEQRSTAFLVRYLYYTGKIETVQLHYGEAYAHLSQALRKAPQKKALGFRVTVSKLLIIVQLLMGEIPDRSTFSQADMKRTLFPYLELTRAVRVGDLAQFMALQNRYRHIFEKDALTHLIMRLRHHVIKAGLRKINTAYSAISIKDIAEKLHLDSVEDAESIIVKAIGDGVMEATLNHSASTLQSNETGDVYSTNEPQTAFHKRIQFCLDIHNESVKALHFPPNAHKLFNPGMDDEEDEEDEEGNIREKTKKDNEESDEKKKKDEKKDDKAEKKDEKPKK